ncbi:hypothetical protein M0811_08733 [Anaeramoeba ignava]|uniref:Uncharacterized protein n=1 Tax=Anaeramoeba ignava TaxID=1746090 RepID=A0A9Q0LLH1_ANAIG|nr:hypothetical protein M0811_08733 [Anaeramoeba ignava]
MIYGENLISENDKNICDKIEEINKIIPKEKSLNEEEKEELIKSIYKLEIDYIKGMNKKDEEERQINQNFNNERKKNTIMYKRLEDQLERELSIIDEEKDNKQNMIGTTMFLKKQYQNLIKCIQKQKVITDKVRICTQEIIKSNKFNINNNNNDINVNNININNNNNNNNNFFD